MAALRSRCGHYIFALSFVLSSFFLAYSQPSHIGCLPYLHTWCGLSADLRCRSETCCAEIQDAKIRHLGAIVQLCRAMSSQLRRVSTIGKKLVKQQYLPQMSSQYGELRLTSGWDRSGSLGHPS